MALVAYYLVTANTPVAGVTPGGAQYTAHVDDFPGSIDANDWIGLYAPGVTTRASYLQTFGVKKITWLGPFAGPIYNTDGSIAFYVPSVNNVIPNAVGYHFMAWRGSDQSLIIDSASNPASGLFTVSNFVTKAPSLGVSTTAPAPGATVTLSWGIPTGAAADDHIELYRGDDPSNSTPLQGPKFTGSTATSGTLAWVLDSSLPTDVSLEFRMYAGKTSTRLATSPAIIIH